MKEVDFSEALEAAARARQYADFAESYARQATKVWMRVDADLPHVRDVSTPVMDGTGGNYLPGLYVGSDGSLWEWEWKLGLSQIASPSELVRVAASPDGAILCVDSRGQLWRRGSGPQPTVADRKTWHYSSGYWEQVPVPHNQIVRDVSVTADLTVWILTTSGRYYTMRGDLIPRWQPTMLALMELAGEASPSDLHPHGIAWGVSHMGGTGALFRAKFHGWGLTNGREVADLSVGIEGVLWFVKQDGSVWTTNDNGQTFLRRGSTKLRRISAGRWEHIFGVAEDGTAWVWWLRSESQPVERPVPPPPEEREAGSSRPSILVTTRGGGNNTIFLVKGSGFVAEAEVTIRGVRIGEGQYHQQYWLAKATKGGDIEKELPLPCLPGIGIAFSANDGRLDPDDLSNRLWSDPVWSTCPSG